MKRLLLIALLCSMVGLVGCSTKAKVSNADIEQREATKRAMGETQKQVGMPAIKNFQERKLAKMIFELRDREDFVCHAYYFNALEG